MRVACCRDECKNVCVTSFASLEINVKGRILSADLESVPNVGSAQVFHWLMARAVVWDNAEGITR